jgi:cell division protein FtsB
MLSVSNNYRKYMHMRQKSLKYLLEKMRFVQVIPIVTLVISLVTLVYTAKSYKDTSKSYQDTSKQNSESQYLSIINTRIQTCTSLSNYHRETLSKIRESDPPRKSIEGKEISSIEVRGSKAADLSRALSLCLAEHTNVDTIKQCVDVANKKLAHLVYDDISPVPDTNPPTGGNVLAC